MLNNLYIKTTLAADKLETIDPGNKDLGEFAESIILNALIIFGIIAVGAIIYGGILYITSAGNPEKVQKATKSLTWSIVGLILIILAYTIVRVLSKDLIDVLN